MIQAPNGFTPLLDSMYGLICSVEDTHKKLNSAEAKLAMTKQKNDKVNALLEKWTMNIRSSENIVLSVQSDIDAMIETQVA